ncbi:hypothetical protein GCM10010112_25130 [Actinoplanes lobatus]|uniref:Cardiolipin synthase N-terminal domain-containing protein n=1 Tax=Actinoplanes lobatus TaxID=113568 RepID=A0ABQ4AY95_9ACTN|nr:hypothetical protein GCM10010112_25130 [Actinoplanes lobatus]GIE45939.1 hypothetical protein Alo02nite_88370 [Actinoplanes lobatus]
MIRRVIRVYSLFALINLILIVVALIDCLSTDEVLIRALPRVVWVLLILLFSPIGAIVWFVAGRPPRPVRLSNGTTWRPGSGFPESERPRRSAAPDDDPEFLRDLAARHAREKAEDQRLMKDWEADLRRREEDLRRREGGEKTG